MKLFDLLIKGGTVADGSGGNPYTADVGILQDKIAFIGNADGAKAAKVIDAGGLIVSPGFIEMHSHDDLDMISNPTVPYKLLQGITTEVIGLCGIGCAPYDPEKAREWENWAGRFLCDTPAPWTWRSFGGFLDRLEEAKASLNVVGLVSHGAIRASVMGLEDRNPAPEELAAMKRLLADSMEQGARGLSTGLIYVPMVYSGPEEMIQLCRVVAEKGGLVVPHVRNLAGSMADAVREFIGIAKSANAPLHISHLGVIGRANWPQMDQALRFIEKAKSEGMDITFDTHSYTGVSSMINMLLPPWVNKGGRAAVSERLRNPEIRRRIKEDFINRQLTDPVPGWEFTPNFAGWDQIRIAGLSNKNNEPYIGMTLQEIADSRNQEPYDAAMDLIAEDEGTVNMAISDGYSIENIRKVIQKGALIGGDGIPAGAHPHPRLYGTFARFFEKFVREEKLLTLPEAVSRVTRESAGLLKLEKRGELKEGYYADITVFDIETIHDRATMAEPKRHPAGIKHVVVNGSLTVEGGKHTGSRDGRVLR